MLGRPEAVGTQAEQELHHLLVGARTDVIVGSIDGLACPGEQRPVLIVDEESAILHGGLLHGGAVALHIDGRHGGRLHVGPPDIGRDADATAYLEEAVGCAARRAAHNDESLGDALGGLMHQLQGIGLPHAGQSRGVHFAIGNQVVDDGGLPDGACNDKGLSTTLYGREGRTVRRFPSRREETGQAYSSQESRLTARDGLEVADDAACHRADHLGIAFVDEEGGRAFVRNEREAATGLAERQIGHGLLRPQQEQQTHNYIIYYILTHGSLCFATLRAVLHDKISKCFLHYVQNRAKFYAPLLIIRFLSVFFGLHQRKIAQVAVPLQANRSK